jgi:hypothetical protein
MKLSVEAYRAHALLAALYVHAGGFGDPVRANYLAALAREIGQQKTTPNLGEILGDANWSPDEIGISVGQGEPRTTQYSFDEDGKKSERVSSLMPIAMVQKGKTDNFKTSPWFMVDDSNAGRPLPFTAPQISVEVQYTAQGGGFTKKHSDARPVYKGKASPLDTVFPRDLAFTLDKDGSLHMRFEIKDPDAKVTRVYDDTLQIQVKP